MTRLSGLTVQEEILLHLHTFKDAKIDIEGPFAATRDGMCRALGIRPNHISRELKVLTKADQILFKLAHVLGFRKCVRVYYLTKKGIGKADRLIASIGKLNVSMTNMSGNIERTTIEKAFRACGGKYSYIDLLRMRNNENVRETRDDIFIPDHIPETFFGRQDELSTLSKWEAQNQSKILVIYGIAGIGKTSLTSRFVKTLKGRSVVFIEVHEWDTSHGVLELLSNLLAGLGEEKLENYLKTRIHADMTNVCLILKNSFDSLAPLVILDDAWKASKELWDLIMLLAQTIKTSNSKMILISREFPSRFDGRLVTDGIATGMRLEGLREDESRQLLEWCGLSTTGREEVQEMVRTLKGHPLLLKMAGRVDDVSALSEGDIAKFIYSEIYSRLTGDELELLKVLAVLRYPLATNVLAKGFSYETIDSLQRKSLTERLKDGTFPHDILRSFMLAYMEDAERTKAHFVAYELLKAGGPQVIEKVYHALSGGLLKEAILDITSLSKHLDTARSATSILNLIDQLPQDAARSNEIIVARMRCLAFIGDMSSISRIYRDEHPEGDESALIAADANLEIGDTDRALKIYSRLRRTELGVIDRIKLLRGLGKCLSMKGDYANAIIKFDNAIKIARENRQKEITGRLLMDFASVEILRGRGQMATKYLLDAMKYVREDEHLLRQLYANLSLTYHQRSMNEMSLVMLDRVIDSLATSGDYVGLMKCKINKGTILRALNRYEESERALLEVIDMARKAGMKPLVAFGLNSLSKVYLAFCRYDDADRTAIEALKIAEEVGNKPIAADIRNYLAVSFIRQGEIKRGIRILIKNLELCKRLRAHSVCTNAIEALVEGYMNLGRRREAVKYAKQGLRIARENGIVNAVRRIESTLRKLNQSSHN